MNANIETIFPLFLILWLLLGAGSAAFFYFNRSATLKRKVLPPFLIMTGALFLGFLYATGAPREVLYVAVPVIALIMVLNMRAIRFCDGCGRTLHNRSPFSSPKFCSKCGAPLQP